MEGKAKACVTSISQEKHVKDVGGVQIGNA